MKILFSLDKFQVKDGGADALAKGVVSALLANGHEVRVVQVGEREQEIKTEGLLLVTRCLPKPQIFRDGDLLTLTWNKLWLDVMRRELAAFAPELLLTQNMLAPSSVRAGQAAGVRTVIFFHGYRCLSPTFFRGQDALQAESASWFNLPWRYKLKWPLISRCLQLYYKAYQNADLVIANSNYTAAVIKKFFQRQADILYPVIDIKAGNLEFKKNNNLPLLFVKPQFIKGIEVLLRVAPLLPDKNFKVVGAAGKSIRRRLASCPNIQYFPWTDNMAEMYEKSSLLFAPAQIPEPFGRVFVEAGSYGVPTVGSASGGIPEAVGKGGILCPLAASSGDWARAIQEALSSAQYENLSRCASEQAQSLLAKHNAERLLDILKLT